MREYTTQMDAARKGIITKEMEAAAKKEQMAPEKLRALIAEGKAIIPCNKYCSQCHWFYAEDKN